MSKVSLQPALHELAQAALEIAKICGQDIKVFASSWHRIASNARVLEHADAVDPEDVKSLLTSIRALSGYHAGSFTEHYIPRDDFEDQVRENKRLDALKDRVDSAVAEVQGVMKIDPRSY